MHYEVVVGNLGTVYAGPSQHFAMTAYRHYVGESMAHYGRAADEPVTLLADNEIVLEHAIHE